MKIATTYDNGNIFQHFGRTEYFKVYEVEDNKIIDSRVIGSDGVGHGALAGLLADQDIKVLICGGLGGGALNALRNAGIVRMAAAGMKNLKRAAAAAAEADVTADSALLWKVKTSAGMSGFTTGEHLMTEHSSTHPMNAESLLHLSAARA